MLKTKLLQPEMLAALARSGHFSKVLITDGNFPAASKANPRATLVSLNLMPGTVKATEVLEAVLDTIVVQDAAVMAVPGGARAPVVDEYRKMLPEGLPLAELERQDFYSAAGSSDVTLVVQTGETRRFANILLTIGVRKLETNENY